PRAGTQLEFRTPGPLGGQPSRHAARTVSGEFGFASVGIEKVNGRIPGIAFAAWLHQIPAICPDAEVAVTDRSGEGSTPAWGRIRFPTEQEVITSPRCFNERY